MKRIHTLFLVTLFCHLFASCNTEQPREDNNDHTMTEDSLNIQPRDVHTYSEAGQATTKHLDLELSVDFESKILTGKATHTLSNPDGSDQFVLDINGLNITNVILGNGQPAKYYIGDEKENLGRPLRITIPEGTEQVTVRYTTSPDAAAILWMDKEQTLGQEHPFMFTQSQAILARSWVPCQDSPGIRFTYSATVHVPKGTMAVMSATNPTEINDNGTYNFEMKQPIPSYLLALAVGNLEYRAISDRAGVYAEPQLIEKAAMEFEDLDKMIAAAEELYGEYRWEKYDLLVLPPSFPFGGMENPRLTFVTPTILAGDKSLTALIAHELAHSWSGNLVTNATWDDFWLNEGFTVYFERRIMESLYGKDYKEMLELLGYQDLEETVKELGSGAADTHLKLALEGRDPDEGLTDVAYEKGYFLLRTLEEEVGREKFDAFLKNYFNEFAFETMNTERFLDYLKANLLDGDEDRYDKLRIEEWVYGPGIPDNVYKTNSKRYEAVNTQIEKWKSGAKPTQLDTADWSALEHMLFLRGLPDSISNARMKALDQYFGYTESNNSEIQAIWYQHAIRNRYSPAYYALKEFLTGMGRRKFLMPLYSELVKTDEGRLMAMEIYKVARPRYHFVAVQSLDEMLVK